MAAHARRPGEGRFANVPVLVVDDNDVNRDLLARRLTREGCVVTCVASGEQALDLAHPDRFHVVLLDIMMPGLSGLEVLGRLRRSFAPTELPVIMVTARDESPDVVRSLDLGANDHVGKPIDYPVLFARVEMQLRLRNLSRLKDEFIRVASHDLKNPLNFLVFGATQIAATTPPGTPLTERSHATLLKMAKRCRDMERIIADFLDFEALQDSGLALRLSATDILALAETVLANQRALADAKSIHIAAEIDPSIGAVQIDAARIGQVLDNLIGNAIKFGRAGDQVRVWACRERDGVLVEISDTGPGVPDAELGRLFEKYARSSNRPTGGELSSGLGLFICRQIVELHGGEIGARNNGRERGGATFWFRLKLGSERVEQKEARS